MQKTCCTFSPLDKEELAKKQALFPDTPKHGLIQVMPVIAV